MSQPSSTSTTLSTQDMMEGLEHEISKEMENYYIDRSVRHVAEATREMYAYQRMIEFIRRTIKKYKDDENGEFYHQLENLHLKKDIIKRRMRNINQAIRSTLIYQVPAERIHRRPRTMEDVQPEGEMSPPPSPAQAEETVVDGNQ